MKTRWMLVVAVVAAMGLMVGCAKKEPAKTKPVKPQTKTESAKTAETAKPAEAAEPVKEGAITLKYANFPPAVTFPCVQMERWKEEVQKRTGGKVQIDTFPGSQLLDAKGMFDGVIAGQADIGCFCMAYQPGRFVFENATALQLGIPNAKVGSRVLWDLYNKYKPESLAKVKVLTMFATAPSNIMSKKAIRTPEDVKGQLLRASGVAVEVLKAWGAEASGMPMSETLDALQKGVVHGLYTSAEVMMDFKIAEYCKYVTMTETVIYPFAVVMNQKSWDALPDDVKKVMDDLALEQCEWTGTYMDNHVKEALEWAKKEHKVEVITLSPEQLAIWNKPLEAVTAKWIQDAKKANLPAEQILADIKALTEKYSKAQ
jgi:TRAP-type C4-dicarboxylate transport system substrate-binding protein